MKQQAFVGLLIFYLVTIASGCINEESSSEVKGREISAIEKTINDLAKAVTDFPKTRDKQSVLRLTSANYVGVQDGEDFNTNEIEEYLSALLERINLGEPVRLSYQATKINTRVYGATAWAT